MCGARLTRAVEMKDVRDRSQHCRSPDGLHDLGVVYPSSVEQKPETEDCREVLRTCSCPKCCMVRSPSSACTSSLQPSLQ